MKNIIELALENLARHSPIRGKWNKNGRGGFEKVDLFLVEKKQSLAFHAEVKERVNAQQTGRLIEVSQGVDHFLLVAGYLSPQTKERLREGNISYLEANGNIFLNDFGSYIWIDTNKPMEFKKETGNRAFTKTGLKVVFHFLLYPDWVQLPYREIAEKTGTSLGNVTNIAKNLEASGFLLRLGKNRVGWNRKKELLDKWIDGYKERLKPSLAMGSFRFLKKKGLDSWKEIRLNHGLTWWGGEPAADLLTNYLRPGEWTLYSRESITELIKNYRLVPDRNGILKAFRAFWAFDLPGNTVPPLLTYADLVNTEDARCLETAQMIYQNFLKDDF